MLGCATEEQDVRVVGKKARETGQQEAVSKRSNDEDEGKPGEEVRGGAQEEGQHRGKQQWRGSEVKEEWSEKEKCGDEGRPRTRRGGAEEGKG